jgi:PAS domain S-box-containing protein
MAERKNYRGSANIAPPPEDRELNSPSHENLQVEDELRAHRDHLDLMVKERTAELIKLNKDLRTEIMRRIRMERELMESQRFVNRITDTTPNIIYLFDLAENRLVYINDRVRDILGYSPEGIKKLKFTELAPPAAREVLKLRKERFSESSDGDIIESEYQMKNSRGELRWFYSRDVVFNKTDDGQPKLILGMAQDISERKITEEEIRNSRQQLRELLAHQQSVREDERTRISREIHDELGQSLTALKMDLHWVARRLSREQKPLLEKTQVMSRAIDLTIKTVQRISAELRPGLLDDLGLAAALEWQADDFQKRTGIRCDLTVSPDYITLNRNVSTAIFRIFQETLTNVARHAKSKMVRIYLRKKENEIMLRVCDNGKGITKKQASSPKSIGLIGMKERVDFLGGRVEITGIKNRGTTVVVHIPVN